MCNFQEIFGIFNRKSQWKINFQPLFATPEFCHFIELQKITPFFYNNFFRFRGGGTFGVFPPWLRHCMSEGRHLYSAYMKPTQDPLSCQISTLMLLRDYHQICPGIVGFGGDRFGRSIESNGFCGGMQKKQNRTHPRFFSTEKVCRC